MGELGVRIWLAELRGGESAVEAPAAGWGGDRLVAYACEDGAAFAWLLRFDTDADADEFAAVAEDAVRRLGAGLRGPAGVERAGRDVLVSAGVPASVREAVRAGVQERVYPDLESYLADHPEVIERARRLRGVE